MSSIQQVNDNLVSCLENISNVGKGLGNNEYDKAVQASLQDFLSGATYISDEKWREEKIFEEYRNSSLVSNFDFTSLNPLPYDLMIVDKPCGAQQWPDILVVYNRIGFPIEIKTCKLDKILWNCSLPHHGCLYIFNCYKKGVATYFLGEHVITSNEILNLKMLAKGSDQSSLKVSLRWGHYVRHMFDSSQRYISDSAVISDREGKVKNFIRNLPWNSSQKTNFDDGISAEYSVDEDMDAVNENIKTLEAIAETYNLDGSKIFDELKTLFKGMKLTEKKELVFGEHISEAAKVIKKFKHTAKKMSGWLFK
ncbi:Uncharacterised protein [uncultured archaeon]|nr:Uncharacterised protein [uncultured archaeon]